MAQKYKRAYSSKAMTRRSGASSNKQPEKKTLARQESFSHGIQETRKRRATTPSEAPKRRRLQGSDNDNGDESPFAGFARPTASEVTNLHTALARSFGERRPKSKRSKREILDTVVGTILSQNTTNTNSHRAFQQLKDQFSTWDAVRVAKPSAVAAAIKCGGLAPKKTTWIQHILRTIHKETGKTSMEYLKKLTKDEVHAELERFQGVGKKTSAIINLFDVGHPDMAVDTHVFRYAVQLGWAPSEKERKAHNKLKTGKHWPVVTRDTVYAHLDSRFPDRLKYSMHLILTDTVGGLPVVCGSQRVLAFDGKGVQVDGAPLKALVA